MSDITIQIKGIDQLRQNLNRIDAEMRGLVALQAVTAGALQIENKARMNAPVLTGALRNSASTISKQTATGAEAEIGFRGLVYARIQEFGGRAGRNHSVYIEGKHYLQNAIDTQQGLALQAMGDVISQYLR